VRRGKGGMEKVDGMMRGLKLTEAERSGLKVGQCSLPGEKVKFEQAVGKLLAGKPATPEEIENALGPVWCPLKGIDCKEIGENIFLFTFLQAGGRKKAVDGGPWSFDKNLIILEILIQPKQWRSTLSRVFQYGLGFTECPWG
jgi:hypothetical protein